MLTRVWVRDDHRLLQEARFGPATPLEVRLGVRMRGRDLNPPVRLYGDPLATAQGTAVGNALQRVIARILERESPP